MEKRVADSTIKGFLYQFNKTIIEIARSEDDEVIIVEGMVEDIDVVSANGELEAIQCKYHETKEKFVPSIIFKPLLQMAEAYDKNPSENINYTIFIYVPNEDYGERDVEISILDAALDTTDRSLSKIAERISTGFDKNEFLKKTKLIFGPSLDDLESNTKTALESLEIVGSDVDTLLYPNSIARISKLSSFSRDSSRRITRKEFHEYLSKATCTAVTKWTLALKNRNEILKKIKQQLSGSLSHNVRERYFYIDRNEIDDYEENIVVFIDNYLKKYYSKPCHLKAPTFVINEDFIGIKNLEARLYKKNIKVNTGLIGDTFEVEHFFREPIQRIVDNRIDEREFEIRLLAMESELNAINHRKGDDFYFVSSDTPISIDLSDVNTYQIGTSNFSELEYVIGIRNSHE